MIAGRIVSDKGRLWAVFSLAPLGGAFLWPILWTALWAGFLSFLPLYNAQAGWFSDLFTFREEQRPRVSPDIVIPPVDVLSPYYENREAVDWARFYTRQDLEPTPYIQGSASYIMRPRQGLQKRASADIAGPWPGGPLNVAPPWHPSRPPPGYETLLWRDYMNRLQNGKRKTHVGEPGYSPWEPPLAGGPLGKKTEIGQPVASWKGPHGAGSSKYGGSDIVARPGDYNYTPPTERSGGYEVYADFPPQGQGGRAQDTYGSTYGSDGREVTRSSGMPPEVQGQGRQQGAPSFPQGGIGQQGRVGGYRGGLPEQYTVVPGDSLSGISEKDRIYGNWRLWPLIYDANRQQINDPDLIHPDQRFGIPRGYSGSQEADARNRAEQKAYSGYYDFYDGE